MDDKSFDRWMKVTIVAGILFVAVVLAAGIGVLVHFGWLF